MLIPIEWIAMIGVLLIGGLSWYLGYVSGIVRGAEGMFEELEKDVNLLVVDSKIDLMDGDDLEAHHTKQLVLHSPNYMFNYSHLGHQFYLNAPEVMETLEKLNLMALSLKRLSSLAQISLKQTLRTQMSTK